MSIIADIRALRGVMIVSTDDGQSLRVRVADFKKMPVESGDEIDFDAYSDRLAAIQLPVAYEAALGMLDFSAKTRRELERALISKAIGIALPRRSTVWRKSACWTMRRSPHDTLKTPLQSLSAFTR